MAHISVGDRYGDITVVADFLHGANAGCRLNAGSQCAPTASENHVHTRIFLFLLMPYVQKALSQGKILCGNPHNKISTSA